MKMYLWIRGYLELEQGLGSDRMLKIIFNARESDLFMSKREIFVVKITNGYGNCQTQNH
jgi:hypothetical protein